MPLLLLQDVARYIEFWRGSPWGAAANDLLWLVGSLGALLLLPRQYASTATVLACWVGSGAFAGVVFAIYLKWRPSAPAAWSWVSGNRRLIMPMLGDYGLIALLQQGTIYVITAIAGLRATAAFRGALVALGPVNVLTAGVSVFLVQLGRRSYEATPKKLPIIMLRRSAAMSAAVLTLCIAVYFMPTQLGELLLGDIWERARPLILPFSFVFATAALNFGPTTGLRLIGEAGRSFRIRAVAAPLMLIAVAVACIHRGVTAAVWAPGDHRTRGDEHVVVEVRGLTPAKVSAAHPRSAGHAIAADRRPAFRIRAGRRSIRPPGFGCRAPGRRVGRSSPSRCRRGR